MEQPDRGRGTIIRRPVAAAIWIVVYIGAAIAAATAIFLLQQPNPAWFYHFANVRGPDEASHIVLAPVAQISDFEAGGPHRLAVLVTDPDSEWLGLARALRAHGVPFTLTEDPARALRHRVILAYPIISGRRVSASNLRALAEHVRAGGTLVTHELAGGGLEQLFGVGAPSSSVEHESLIWTQGNGSAEETETRFSRRKSEAQMGSYAYAATTAGVIATYENGAPAVLCRKTNGVACVMGVDIGALARRAMDGRAEPVARRYVNTFEPSLDVPFRWLRDVYVAGEPMPWLIDTAPAGRDVSIVITHDVDFTRSVHNMTAFSDALRARDVKGTFFVQTKYVRDYNDDAFLTDDTVPTLGALRQAGMELGSHTVAHSVTFNRFPLGSGNESYPSYRPFVLARDNARDGSILGELRVSRFLLEQLTSARVSSFRPGALSYPFQLPEALEATGYRNSSSITANATLTHLPFQLTESRAGRALSPVFEFPVTIEDEELPRLGERFDAANALVERVAAHHGVAVVLVHPDVTDHKLAFEERLVDTWRTRAWIGPLEDFGTWWRARDALSIDISRQENSWTMQVEGVSRVAPVAVLLPKARAADGSGKGRRMVLLPDEDFEPLQFE